MGNCSSFFDGFTSVFSENYIHKTPGIIENEDNTTKTVS
jgi:hypothetical protein